MDKIEFTKLIKLFVRVIFILLFGCISVFTVLIGVGFYELLTNGAPVVKESKLSEAVKNYYSQNCQVKSDKLIIFYPQGLPKHEFGFYSARSSGFFHAYVAVEIGYLGTKTPLDIKLTVYPKEDRFTINSTEPVACLV